MEISFYSRQIFLRRFLDGTKAVYNTNFLIFWSTRKDSSGTKFKSDLQKRRKEVVENLIKFKFILGSLKDLSANRY